jgi:hypothetical protein
MASSTVIAAAGIAATVVSRRMAPVCGVFIENDATERSSIATAPTRDAAAAPTPR